MVRSNFLPPTPEPAMGFEQLDEADHVFSINPLHPGFSNNTNPGKVHKTSALVKFAQAQLLQALGSPGWGKGVEGELLKLGSSRWIKGAIRFRVIIEFHSDEPEPAPPAPPTPAELDEFR